MRSLALVFVVLVACGGNDSDSDTPAADGAPIADGGDEPGADAQPEADAAPPTFVEVAAEYVEAYCYSEAQCGDGNQSECEERVSAEMLMAEQVLEDAQEPQCMECMQATAKEFSDFAVACDFADYDSELIYAACDLDPDSDWDGDGQNTDRDEACAGYPFPPE